MYHVQWECKYPEPDVLAESCRQLADLVSEAQRRHAVAQVQRALRSVHAFKSETPLRRATRLSRSCACLRTRLRSAAA